MSTVSIIVPCYNEQRTIGLLLDATYAQTYPRQQIEVVIADGMSTDHTREVITGFQAAHPDLKIKVVDNPARNIPAGLNRALAASQGEFVVRLDAHCVPIPEYVERCVSGLEKGLGDNVSGVWDIQPGGSGVLARAIAMAAAHPLGVGDARYRYSNQAQEVDTVPFGAFRRSLTDRIGGFDETLLSNEDYEFNVRIRQAGGKVWLDPAIRSTYFARASLVELAKQYWRYGYWKVKMLRRYASTIRWRQALPPLFVLSLLILGVLSILISPPRWILAAEVVLYSLILFFVGARSALRERALGLIIGVPLAIATMHLFWGGAFLWSTLETLIRPPDDPVRRR